jgi:hypothetical protein
VHLLETGPSPSASGGADMEPARPHAISRAPRGSARASATRRLRPGRLDVVGPSTGRARADARPPRCPRIWRAVGAGAVQAARGAVAGGGGAVGHLGGASPPPPKRSRLGTPPSRAQPDPMRGGASTGKSSHGPHGGRWPAGPRAAMRCGFVEFHRLCAGLGSTSCTL